MRQCVRWRGVCVSVSAGGACASVYALEGRVRQTIKGQKLVHFIDDDHACMCVCVCVCVCVCSRTGVFQGTRHKLAIAFAPKFNKRQTAA